MISGVEESEEALMKKRILSLFIVLCVVLAVLPTASFTSYAATVTLSGSGTVDDPYLLYDASDLTQFKNIVNGEENYVTNVAACAMVMNDIMVSHRERIGTPENPYSGTFTAVNGKKLSGVWISSEMENGPKNQVGFLAMRKMQLLRMYI